MPDNGLVFRSFAQGSDRFFDAVRPYSGAGSVWFPNNLQGVSSRRNSDESLRDWFERMIENLGRQAPYSFLLEENIGLLATIKWTSNSSLTYANIQVIIAPCPLDEYFCDASQKAFYLRLDCDKQTLGELFTHPHPHIHLDDDLSPRFALDNGTSENVIVDFVEFVYRHFKPDLWLEWARSIWDRDYAHHHPATREKNPFPRIVEAFKASQFHLLQDYQAEMLHLKRLLFQEKERMSDLRLSKTERELLEYP